MSLNATPTEATFRRLSLSYNNANSQTSALQLVLSLFPEWEHSEGKIEFVRFTDGITNTLLKAIKKRPGYTEEQIDNEAVLLRAYGKGTEVLIDRDRETTSHSLLAQHHLAPALLARFHNGLLYKFIRGRVCTPADLKTEPIWKGVARRLGEWHAILPIVSTDSLTDKSNGMEGISLGMSKSHSPSLEQINAITPNKSTPNIWTVMQKWIFALPVTSETEKTRQITLQQELVRTVKELGDSPGHGKDGVSLLSRPFPSLPNPTLLPSYPADSLNKLVFGHCDLLSGNIIVEPPTCSNQPPTISFIDYEYAAPSPAAFDIANHFAEWGGFDCDYSVLPTRPQRRSFLYEYLSSYHAHLPHSSQPSNIIPTASAPFSIPNKDLETEVSALFDQIDAFRGIPGFYWGIWALIQATISQIDFDYASYAETRLGEYWAWRAEESGEREKKGEAMGTREKRWRMD